MTGRWAAVLTSALLTACGGDSESSHGGAGAAGGGTGGSAGAAGSAGSAGGAGTAGGAGAGGSGATGGSSGGGSGGLGAPETLATGEDAPTRIEVTGANVYWLNRGAGFSGSPDAVRRMPKSGGAPTSLDSGQVTGIVADEGGVFWANTDRGEVMSAAPDGTGATTIAGYADFVGDMAIAESNLYFTIVGSFGAMPSVQTVAKTGGTPAPLFSNENPLAFIEAAGSAVFFTDLGNAGLGRVLELDTSMGGATPLATDLERPWAIALDSSDLFIVTGDDGAIHRVPRGGGTSTKIAQGQDSPYGVAVDDDFVYWTTQGGPFDMPCDNTGGALWHMPKSGGPATELATGLACPYQIAVDDTGVYWVNAGVDSMPSTGSVMRVPKL